MNREQDRVGANFPAPGDYWHEMYAPMCVVIQADENEVVFLTKVKPAGERKWAWDLDAQPEVESREAFSKRFAYRSVPGYYARCEPRLHHWVVEDLAEAEHMAKIAKDVTKIPDKIDGRTAAPRPRVSNKRGQLHDKRNENRSDPSQHAEDAG